MKKRFSLLFFFVAGILAGLFAKEIQAFLRNLLRDVAPSLMSGYLRQQSTEDLQNALEASGQRISQKLVEKHPYKFTYWNLRHIIGIEKWGQSRLRVALGEPFVFDEYDDYRPSNGLSWNELQDEFAQTRAETLALISEIRDNDSYHSYRILHNEFGELSVDSWLFYLRIHADNHLLLMR